MIDDQFKWWRWIGEESLSGGVIGLHEGGNTFPCGIRRPSEHSMMRWIGFYFDQVGREHMTYRITGRRNANAMSLVQHPDRRARPRRRPLGRDPAPAVRRAGRHLARQWRRSCPGTDNSRNLDLAGLDSGGRRRRRRDRPGRDGVRPRPVFKNGPADAPDRAVDRWRSARRRHPSPAAFTLSTTTDTPVGGDEVVYVETHAPDRPGART